MGTETTYDRPDSPTQNHFIKSFHGRWTSAQEMKLATSMTVKRDQIKLEIM
jgi:hypothetical protein